MAIFLKLVVEAQNLYQLVKQLVLAPIVLMTPTNIDECLLKLAESADGFIDAVARRGVTGSQTEMDNKVATFVGRCKKITDLPLAVGFGVSDKKDIEFIAKYTDIAIIGTVALRAWENDKEAALSALFKELLS